MISPVQTVVNTMCGYGMQPLQESMAGLSVFTMGCLEKIVWWAKHNLLLVAGLTAGLLLLEVNTAVGVAVFSPQRPQGAVHSIPDQLEGKVFSKSIFCWYRSI